MDMFFLAVPILNGTGQSITNVTGYEASTIHKSLKLFKVVENSIINFGKIDKGGI